MIEIFRTKNKQFAFRVRAKNGKILVTSECYKRKASVYKAADALFHIMIDYCGPVDKTEK